MANTSTDIKAPQAASLGRYNEYELNKKLKTGDKTKAVGMSAHAHGMTERLGEASRVNLHSWTMAQ